MRATSMITLILTLLIVLVVPVAYCQDVFTDVTKSIKEGFENATNTIIATLGDMLSFLKNVIIKLSQIAAVILALIGCFLWFSGISPYSGKRMVISAALLALFVYILRHISF